MYVAIEGIIGAGKSTVAKYISKELNWVMLPEPVDNNPLLELFYKDQKRWATMLQMYFLFHRYDLQQIAGHSNIPCILDRSLMGDKCFFSLQKKYGNILPAEAIVYEKGYQTMANIRPPCLMVYLDVDPKTSFERIHRRGRSCEKEVPLQYLEDLSAEYETLISQIEEGKQVWTKGIQIMRFPWNVNYANDLHDSSIGLLIEKVKHYIDASGAFHF